MLRRCLEVVKDILLVLLGAGVPPPRAILAAASAQTLMLSVKALSTKQPAQFEYPAPYSVALHRHNRLSMMPSSRIGHVVLVLGARVLPPCAEFAAASAGATMATP